MIGLTMKRFAVKYFVWYMLCWGLVEAPALMAAEPSSEVLHIPFWESADVVEPLGGLKFQANPLQKEGLAEGYPAMLFGCEVPREDGAAWVYGWKLTNWQEKSTRTVEVVRCTTRDGRTFTNEETVLSLVNPDWQGFVNIVHRPTDGKLFLFSYSAGNLYVYESADGKKWDKLTEKAYVAHDAMNITWHGPTSQLLNYQVALEHYQKRYPDNIGGDLRRVLSFKTSQDGVTWEAFSPPFLNGQKYMVPDDQDPVDLEFYRSIAFPTQGRYAMLLQDYIAPPPEANSRRKTTKHGPRSEVEWAISPDGLNWKRPFRDMDATAVVGSLPVQGPLVREGMLRFYERDRVITSLPEGRLFYVTGRGNCEFSTPVLAMPGNGLTLDADVAYSPVEGETGRKYLMAELRDAEGRVIPGYEREKCLFENQDGRALPLNWDRKTGGEFKGQKVQLRLFFREARVYSISGALATP